MTSFKQVANSIISKRKATLDFYEVSKTDAINSNAQLLTLEKQIRLLTLNEVKGKKIDKKELVDLIKKRDATFKKLGIKTTAPPPTCSKCSDTAFFKGNFCQCVISHTLTNPKNISIPLTNFSDIDYKRFDPKTLDNNKLIYIDIEKIANKFPLNNRQIITIIGATGTGKTLLAGAATKQILTKGFSAIAITAFDFFSRAQSYHTTFDDTKDDFLAPLLTADLLVIDDLGTEVILNNITHQYLYSILAERIANKKLTFITANLSQEGILSRYGERIYSRLFDKALSYRGELEGKDLRV